MMGAIPQAYRPLIVPAAILAAAALAVALGAGLPPGLEGLVVAGPYALLGLGAAVTLWFNRGRALVAALSMLAAYGGYRYALGIDPGGFAPQAAYVAAVLLVPANMLASFVLPERGAVHHGSWRWLLLIALEALLVAWVAASGHSMLSGEAWHRILQNWTLRYPPVPFVGRVLFAAAFAAAVWRAWPRFTPLDVGNAAALVAFFIACAWVGRFASFAAFMSAAGVILLVAVLQESHRLAFRDELTGLPSRRALDERMRALGPDYAVAMVDVDHFKKFNDTHGHDVGDQVLRLVAARLADVGGGGRAFRYGGEEFTVLFPDAAMNDVLPHLERIRQSIEDYRMAIRGGDRPRNEKKGSRRRGAREDHPGEQALSVTVSIGAAGPGKRAGTPAEVIKAADEALYRAKQGGRNRVSR
ncbi:MAG: diguanylate cyclase [Burkholderiales bacterium]